MKKFLSPLIILCILIHGFLFNACAQVDNNKIEKIKKEQKHVQPCELFTANEIKAYFNIPDGLELQMKDSDMPYPSCSTQWTLGTKKKMKMSNGMEYDTDVWNNFMLVVVDGVQASAFEAGTSYYKDKEALDVGDQSAWSAKSKQITVLTGTTLFHLKVNAPDHVEDTKKVLIDLANELIHRL